MKNIVTRCFGLLAALSVLCPMAYAEVTYEIIGDGSATDISADGSVIVGNTGSYETFRWTAEEGIVPLGMPSTFLGGAAGSPDVSADGLKVSATILGADSTYVTQGLWTLGSGWQETMPPPPPDGGMMGDAYGSAWGLSGDGQTLVGLYWRPGQPGGSAHASAWTEATGVVDLGAEFGNSRANDASFDGSVIVGWDEAEFGNWRPAVWVDGSKTILSINEWSCEATAVTPDGSMVLGYTFDEVVERRVAAAWQWTDSEWREVLLGILPGSHPQFGLASPNDVTPDGSMVVGYNRASDPSTATGFIWTAETGMVDVEDFLAENGITIDPMFNILTLTGVSDDGTIMVGIGQEMVWPFNNKTFIIRTNPTTAVPELTNRNQLGANYPNPFNPATTIPVTIARGGSVRLEVFDASGRRVRVLHSGELPAGTHQFHWDGTDDRGGRVPSGIYLARFGDPTGATASRRMTLVK